jgi:hypothetical protein
MERNVSLLGDLLREQSCEPIGGVPTQGGKGEKEIPGSGATREEARGGGRSTVGWDFL